ncbi:hypothetical protein SAOR_15810 [Salinisphaera orenii MK-B5]|uniref:Uncharacterized protein n=1 Tax=Salinisphaera orenii MK-B5 TaxID=856730 RepID=A0A423PFC9_9GAMM|nr:hypothetical protein [Salinisphaera orenii]ROO24307.1 hypothetical protein SAOR_15810 [Salinisphaera orenii MK-B5]
MKITLAAIASPALAAVWTMLFSSTLASADSRRMPRDNIAAGIEADTVSPANSPG